MRNKTYQSGFTLIEIMVVIVIIGILAAAVLPNLMGEPDKARVVKAKSDIQSLEAALERYRLDNFRYPTTEQGLQALVNKPSGSPEPRNYPPGGYIKSLPQDPWGNDYAYLNPGKHGQIDIFSLGADGQPGGQEMNADIGNWTPNSAGNGGSH